MRKPDAPALISCATRPPGQPFRPYLWSLFLGLAVPPRRASFLRLPPKIKFCIKITALAAHPSAGYLQAVCRLTREGVQCRASLLLPVAGPAFTQPGLFLVPAKSACPTQPSKRSLPPILARAAKGLAFLPSWALLLCGVRAQSVAAIMRSISWAVSVFRLISSSAIRSIVSR